MRAVSQDFMRKQHAGLVEQIATQGLSLVFSSLVMPQPRLMKGGVAKSVLPVCHSSQAFERAKG